MRGLACVLSIAAFSVCACDDDDLVCTAVGYYDGLRVELIPRGGEHFDPLPAGNYRFDVAADGVAVVLHAPVEEGRIACADGAEACSDSRSVSGHVLWVAVGYDNELYVSYPAPDDPVGGPDAVSVTVDRDGDQVASATFEPFYSEPTEPNGDGCGWYSAASGPLTID